MSNWLRKIKRNQQREMIKEFKNEAGISMRQLKQEICDDNKINRVISQKALLQGVLKLAMSGALNEANEEAPVEVAENTIEDAVLV